MFSKKVVLSAFLFLLALSASWVWAAMTGGVYKIDSDSVNSGGAEDSSFGNYTMNDTVGEIAIGNSTSTHYQMMAGYRQMEDASLAIGVSIQNINLVPALGGLTGGTSAGATEVLVTTDDPAGYSLTLQAEHTPALTSGDDTIADYTPAGPVPDFGFSVAVGQSVFAFTPEGPDIIDRYRDDGGSTCGVVNGNDTAYRCWDGLSTLAKPVAYRGFETSSLGATTTLRFSAGVGANSLKRNGLYYATTTITALAL